MLAAIRQICMLSVLCGVVMALTPEGGVKRSMTILSTLLLSAAVLTAVKDFDFDAYALELTRYREQEQRFVQTNSDLNSRLSRLVIEEECESYILDKAENLGLTVESIDLETQWDMDGLWVPYRVSITYRGEERLRARMEERIMSELGIPKDRQSWVYNA